MIKRNKFLLLGMCLITNLLLVQATIFSALAVEENFNLLTNGDFEEAEEGDIVPDGWEINIAIGEADLFLDTENKFEGDFSVKIEVTTSGQCDWRQLVTDIDADKKYDFSAAIYATNVGGGSHSAELQWFGEAGYISRDIIFSDTAKKWKVVSLTGIKPPSNADRVYVLLRAYKVGEYWFDNISLNEAKKREKS